MTTCIVIHYNDYNSHPIHRIRHTFQLKSIHDCLSSRSRSLRLDVSADQGLLQDGEQAALGLLALSGADVDEVVDAGGGCGGYK